LKVRLFREEQSDRGGADRDINSGKRKAKLIIVFTPETTQLRRSLAVKEGEGT